MDQKNGMIETAAGVGAGGGVRSPIINLGLFERHARASDKVG